jgi:predicted deacetylase
MAHYLTSDEKYRDLIHDDDYRSYLVDRGDSLVGYRFRRMQGKRIRVHARTARSRVDGYFRNMIEAIANAKLRRMERELELRGIRLDRLNDS